MKFEIRGESDGKYIVDRNDVKELLVSKAIECLCIAMINMVFAEPMYDSNIDTSDSTLESILANADRIEEMNEGILYSFDKLNGTVLKTDDKNNTMVLTIKEDGYPDNVIKVDQDNNLYLNENQIVISYEYPQTESENVISPRLTTRYYESDSGNPSLYTVLGKTEKVANIYFQSAIGGLATTVVLGVISTIVPGISFTASVAAGLGTAFASANTKGISCVIEHYYREG